MEPVTPGEGVPKPGGQWRLVVDFRRLNRVTIPNPFPMPRIDEILDKIGDATLLTTLDLTKGYWQIPIAEVSKAKTAFVTPMGKYQFETMPFGLVGAPATFQRYVNSILADMTKFAAAYLDDIVIHSTSWTEHVDHVKRVLQRLRERGLRV